MSVIWLWPNRSISLLCRTARQMLESLTLCTLNINWKCTRPSSPAWYMVSDYRLAVDLQFMDHCVLMVITGAYVVAYITSAYVLL